MDLLTLSVFLTVAGIIFIGFLGEFFFNKFQVSGTIILLLTGLALGQLAEKYGAEYLISVETFKSLEFIVGAITLVMLLFNGGMLLNIYTVIKNTIRPIVYGVLIIVLSSALVGLITHFVFGWNLLVGLLLGVILSGSNPVTTIPIANKLQIDEKTRTFIILEPSFSEVICAVLVVTLTNSFLYGIDLDPRLAGKDLLSQFSIGAVIGSVVGVLWIVLLKRIERVTEYIYMATFALLLFMFVVVEYFEASGYIAALMFGLMLGNRHEIANMLRLGVEETYGDKVLKHFHEELSFLVRTFFFVYLGFIVPVPSADIVLISIIIMAGLLIARYLATILGTLKSEIAKYNLLITSFVDRGLSAAVLSTYPLTHGGIIPANVYLFPSIAFTVIVISSIVSTVGMFIFRPKKEMDLQKPTEKADEGVERQRAEKKSKGEISNNAENADKQSKVDEDNSTGS